jgi:hypothetical protein
MKSRVLFLIALAVSCLDISAQNLVPNGSFEEGSECPMFLDDLHNRCDHWYKSIQVPGVPMNENPSPDWYHACSEVEFLTPPELVTGYQFPNEGEGFAALFNYDIVNDNNRELMGIELNESLVIGEVYYLSFNLSTEYNALNNGIATDKFGFKLTTYQTFSSTDQAVDNISNGYIDEIHTDTLGWTEYNFEFLADSNYRYLHFGVFFTDDQLQTMNFGNPNIARYSYVFIDNVILSSEPLSTDIDISSSSFKIYPNPFTDVLKINSENPLRHITFYTAYGSQIKSVAVSNEEVAVNMGNLPKGLYIIQIVLKNGKVSYQTIVKS